MRVKTATGLRPQLRQMWRRLPGKQPLFELWRRGAAPPERIWRHLHFEGAFEVPLPLGATFHMRHFGQLVENELFWAGYGNGWEGTSLRLWALLAPQARTILDIGANSGVYALAAAALNPAARVFAFEPSPCIAGRLRGNVAINRLAVEVVEAAASNRSGAVTLFEPETEHHYSASLEAAMLPGAEQLKDRTVRAVRLDDFAAARRLARLDLVKIDAEMHEAAVIEGLGGRLDGDTPVMLVEILTPDLGEAVRGRLSGFDYRLFRIDEGEALVPMDALGLRPGNHLLCPRLVAERLGIVDGIGHGDLPRVGALAGC